MLPDTGERYLSTFLMDGVNEGSDDAWLEGLGGPSVAALAHPAADTCADIDEPAYAASESATPSVLRRDAQSA